MPLLIGYSSASEARKLVAYAAASLVTGSLCGCVSAVISLHIEARVHAERIKQGLIVLGEVRASGTLNFAEVAWRAFASESSFKSFAANAIAAVPAHSEIIEKMAGCQVRMNTHALDLPSHQSLYDQLVVSGHLLKYPK